MKAPGDAAMELPWLPPSAAALAALTRPHSPSLWALVRHDPGCVLLLLRAQADAALSLSANLCSLTVLESALELLENACVPFVDWRAAGAARVAAVAQRQAWLAGEIAARVAGGDAERAWVAGLLAPLGWLALTAQDSAQLDSALAELDRNAAAHVWQREAWGLDHTALTRRLARQWRLPAWLVAVVGNLGLHVRIAERLGADPVLFQIVQLSVALVQERDRGLGLPVGATVEELAGAFDLAPADLEPLAERSAHASMQITKPDGPWTPTVLADLLRLAVAERRQVEAAVRLQQELEQLQQALEQQCRDEKDHLQALKLAALAELAAGAGHEINNPLAVISGQAQYLLKQRALAEEQLVEDPSPTLYLDSLKSKLHKALTTIIGQAQRIHHVLTDLMQFARPTTPRTQPIALPALLRDALASLKTLAEDKKVGVTCSEAPVNAILRGDAGQWRTVIGNVVRNALEAAPTEGWVRIRCEQESPEEVEVHVEDNGPGPAPALREHLFDPFFSGRAAGRGRGLGLSTAWRLARQNGGDVSFAGANAASTSFVIRVPLASESAALNEATHGNGQIQESSQGSLNKHHPSPLSRAS